MQGKQGSELLLGSIVCGSLPSVLRGHSLPLQTWALTLIPREVAGSLCSHHSQSLVQDSLRVPFLKGDGGRLRKSWDSRFPP